MLSGYVKRVKSGKISMFRKDYFGDLMGTAICQIILTALFIDISVTSKPILKVLVCDAYCGIG